MARAALPAPLLLACSNFSLLNYCSRADLFAIYCVSVLISMFHRKTSLFTLLFSVVVFSASGQRWIRPCFTGTQVPATAPLLSRLAAFQPCEVNKLKAKTHCFAVYGDNFFKGVSYIIIEVVCAELFSAFFFKKSHEAWRQT